MFIDLLYMAIMFFFYAIGIIVLTAYLLNYRKQDPSPNKKYGVSVIVPMWNEEATIANTLDHLIAMKKEYDGPYEILVVDNNSKDNGVKIVKKYVKKYKFIRLEFEKEKQGKSFTVNTGIKKSKYELIATVDADSFPRANALQYVVGYFNNPKVGAVSTKMKVRDPKTLIEKFQNIEYMYSNFYMLALDYLGAIFVTRGPLSVFRKSVLLKIKGFVDPKITPTEDMEITFRIRKAGYEICASKNALIDTKVMPTWKALYIQRQRWSTGTMKTFILHKDMLLNPVYNFFGLWVGPAVAFSYFLLLFVVYYFIREVITNYHTIYAFIWNLFNNVPFNTTWVPVFINHPIFYLSYYMIFSLFSIFLLITAYNFAFKESEGKVKGNFIAFIFYVFIYYIFLLFSNIIAIGKTILKKDVRWR